MDPKFESVDLEEALLRAGRDVRMSPELRDQTLAALGVTAIGVTAASTATAKTGWLASLASKPAALLGAGVVGALGVAGAVAVTGGWFESDEGPSSPEPAAAVALTERTSPREAAVEEESFAEAAEEAPAEEASTVEEPKAPTTRDAARSAGRSKARAERAAPTSEPTSLGEEVAQLGRVEASLRAGKPQEALARLAEYRERFPRPRLGLEAEVLTIQALAESGSTAAARARATRFIERHPTSPLGARVKRYAE